MQLDGSADVLRGRVRRRLPYGSGPAGNQRYHDDGRQFDDLVEQPGQFGDAAVGARVRTADDGRPPSRPSRAAAPGRAAAERTGAEDVRSAELQPLGPRTDRLPGRIGLVCTAGPHFQLHRRPRCAAAALEVLVEPAKRARPGGVVQPQQAGDLLRGMVAGTQLDPLGAGQLLIEGSDLAGVEDAVPPCTGDEDGRAVGIDAVHVRARGSGPRPSDDFGRVAVGEEVGQHPLELGALASGGHLYGSECGGGLQMPGLAAVQRVDQVPPTAHRGHRFDPRVGGGSHQGQAAAQGETGHPDTLRIGRSPGEDPVDDRRDVRHVLGSRNVDLSSGEPEAADGVGDHDIAA